MSFITDAAYVYSCGQGTRFVQWFSLNGLFYSVLRQHQALSDFCPRTTPYVPHLGAECQL